MTVLAPFLEQLSRKPEGIALISASGQVLSFAGLDRWSSRVAKGCRRAGIGSGNRVLVALGMTPRLYATLIGLWRVGAVAVFPEPAMGLNGLRHAVNMARTAAYTGPAWLGPLCSILPRLPPLGKALMEAEAGTDSVADVTDGHPALITFTSGSTGLPKGIVRSHGFLLAQQHALAPLLAKPDEGADLISLPMFVLANLALGIPSVIPEGNLRNPARLSGARLLAQSERHGVTRIVVPPSICQSLAVQTLPRSITRIVTGGGPVFPALGRALIEAAPHATVTTVYGSTEAEPIAHIDLNALSSDDWRAMETGGGLIAGSPVPDIRLRLMEDEIVVTGNHVNKGYLDPRSDTATKRSMDGDIWHRTGDAGRLDSVVRRWLLGRAEQAVNGLFPFAVEAAARSWPGVRQAALVNNAGNAVLALAGDPESHAALWQKKALQMGDLRIAILPHLPLDRRHNAKIDYARLKMLLASRRSHR